MFLFSVPLSRMYVVRLFKLSDCRKLVNETYKPPQIPLLPDGESSLEYLSQQYLNDYRRLYIEHPRIRMDGVYIAVCHYM